MEQELHIMEEVDFWTSRVILTGAELDVFTHLDGEALTAEQLAVRIGGNPRVTDRLLDALAALGLLEKQERLFSLSPKGEAPLLQTSGNDVTRRAPLQRPMAKLEPIDHRCERGKACKKDRRKNGRGTEEGIYRSDGCFGSRFVDEHSGCL